jgi:hypothetical protein
MWLKLYDPQRSPAHWLEMVRPGEHCVFILDAKLRTPKDADGREFSEGEAAVEITPDFATAVRFAEDVVTRHPELCCEIYGSEGKSDAPLRTVYEPSVRGRYEGLPWAKREASIGVAVVAVGTLMIIYDARHDLSWMWGYIVGAKCVIIGGAYLIRGITGMWENRSERQS